MRTRRVPLAALTLALACATGSGEPQRLLALGRTELRQQDLAAAYAHLSAIREDYPKSAESREAFRLAARSFQGLHAQHRNTGKDPEWLPRQSAFMFEWLASFYTGDEFPRAEAEALLLGMPAAFLGEYRAYAATHPPLARWTLSATDDNGLIDSLSAERSGPG